MDEKLNKNIIAWLEKQGYSLEMKVADYFSEKQFHVNLSTYYEDIQSNTFREIDVVASTLIHEFNKTGFDISLVVECKYSKGKPWLLFQSDSDIELRKRFEITRRFSSKYCNLLLGEISTVPEAQKNFLFTTEKKISYGMTRAFEENQDMTFKAQTSVLKAAKYFSEEFERLNENHGINFIRLAFPVIVIDGPLITCKLSKENKYELEDTDWGYILVRNDEYGTYDSIINIVTIKSFKKYLEKISIGCSELSKTIKENSPKFHEMMKRVNKRT